MNTETGETGELQVLHKTQPMAAQQSTSALLFDPTALGQIEKFAEMMASGKSTIPEHLQGNISDCMAVTMQALQWKMIPHSVAQKTHLVKGTLGYEAQLVNAVINSMAPTKDRLHFEWFGPWENILGKFKVMKGQNGKADWHKPDWSGEDEKGCGVKVWATLKGEDEPRELELLLQQATVRNSTLWASDPKQQLAYLATKRWSRLYCPDVIMGVYTPDELQEIPEPIEKDITSDVDDLNQKLKDEKVETLTSYIGKAKTIDDLNKVGKMIGNEPKDVQDKVRGPYDVKIKALKAAMAKQNEAYDQAVAEGAPSYAEIMSSMQETSDKEVIESALSMINHLPPAQQAELQVAAGNALERVGS